MRTAAIIVAVALVLGVLVGGVGWVKTQLLSIRDEVKETVRETQGEQHLYDQLVRALKDHYAKYEDRAVRLATAEEELEQLKKTTETLKAKLDQNRRHMASAVKLLESNSGNPNATKVSIAGNDYTLAQVRSDLKYRVDACKTLEERIASNKVMMGRMAATIAAGRKQLAEAERQIKQMHEQAKAARERIKYEKFESERLAMEEALRSSIVGPVDTDNDAAEILAELKKRAAELEERNKFRAERLGEIQVQRTDGVVEWEPGSDVLQDARKYLEGAKSGD
jgi:chromosome segregation ATPase